jgi:hypothetical protein
MQDERLSLERQIKLGQALQGKGAAILNSISVSEENKIDFKEIDESDLAKLLSEASSAIEKGTKIENIARRTLSRLT